MPFQRVVPVLRIFSIGKAEEFYLEFLGMQEDWRHRFDAAAPHYIQVSREGLYLHLSEHHGDACPGATLFIEMIGLHAFHREIGSRDYAYARPGIESQSWGFNEMTVIDPFGNRLRFAERRSS